jgi:cytochrome P450
MTVSWAALRRNIAKDFQVDDVTIKRGDFLLYSIGGVHLDPNIYADPSKFDPGRYLEDREEGRREVFSFLGWGAGRFYSRSTAKPLTEMTQVAIPALERKSPNLKSSSCWPLSC